MTPEKSPEGGSFSSAPSVNLSSVAGSLTLTTCKQIPDETAELADRVPHRLLPGLRAYAIDHVQPGQFLTAVLSNDLNEAVGRADPESLAGLRGIMEYVYNALPSNCWGSKEKVAAWLAENPFELPY